MILVHDCDLYLGTFCMGLKRSEKCAALSLTLLLSPDSERSAQYRISSCGVRIPARDDTNIKGHSVSDLTRDNI